MNRFASVLVVLASVALACAVLVVPAAWSVGDQRPPRENSDIFGDDVELVFERITVDDGLPENSVRSMIQDSAGFLWFGTQNGLVRYDGYDMQVFLPDPGDTTSLGGRTILALQEDDEGMIWIGSFLRGLWRYDPRLGTFAEVKLGRNSGDRPEANRVNAICQDQQGRIWVGMQYGLVSIERATGQVTWHDELLTEAPLDQQVVAISSVMADDQGRIWCGTERSGVAIFYPDESRARWFNYRPDQPLALASPTIHHILQVPDRKIWLATEAGLSLWQEATEEFITYRPAEESDLVGSNIMVRIRIDEGGLLWVGSAIGLYVFDPAEIRFRLFAHKADHPMSPVDGPVLSLLFDESGILWAGSWHTGLNKVNPEAGSFRNREFPISEKEARGASVEVIYEDSDGTMWVGTSDSPRGRGNGRLFRRRPGEAFEALEVSGSRNLATVKSLAEDDEGTIWVGSWLGMWKVDENVVVPVAMGTGAEARILRDTAIRSIASDTQGQLWLATTRGLVRWAPATNELQRYQHNVLNPQTISVFCQQRPDQFKLKVNGHSRL